MSVSLRHFEVTEEELSANIESYVDGFIASLQSFFLVMPKGPGFIDFTRFERAYNNLRNATDNFRGLSNTSAETAVRADPLTLVVLRVMAGLSPPELASLARTVSGIAVDQATARRLDKRAREGRALLVGVTKQTRERVTALIFTAVQLLTQGIPQVGERFIHRLDKIDTRRGVESLQELAAQGVPYSMLLYERFLGRPFATHRDTVSGQVGDILENAVVNQMVSRGIPYYKAGVAERFEDMDQAPDFFVPDQSAPKLLIEAKLAEDDGTARDKVTRIQHLAELRDQRVRQNLSDYELVACIDGRGFGIRREDVKKLLLATKGKLFTLQTIRSMVESTGLKSLAQRI